MAPAPSVAAPAGLYGSGKSGIATFALFQRPFPPLVSGVGAAEKPARKPWSRGEIVTAIAFGIAVVGWMLPGIFDAAGKQARIGLFDVRLGGQLANELFATPRRRGLNRNN